jgi:RimJ/RimL family protein N-acetyltransferase
MKPIGEHSRDQWDMRQSLLSSLPERKKNMFGITRSDSPQDALRRQHIYHCLEVMNGYMDGHLNYVVMAGKKPAGMLSMSELPGERGVKINGVIGLPDTKGVGIHAIRAAIERSMKGDGGGRVELNYLPSNSANLRAFYTKAGFVERGYFNDAGNYVTHMILDANKAKEFLRSTDGNTPRFVS